MRLIKESKIHKLAVLIHFDDLLIQFHPVDIYHGKSGRTLALECLSQFNHNISQQISSSIQIIKHFKGFFLFLLIP